MFVVLMLSLFLLSWMMKTFDVSWSTALETLPRLIFWIICVGVVFVAGLKTATPVYLGAPFALAFLVPVFKPIIEVSAGIPENGGLVFDDQILWWGSSWGMFLIFIGINVVGYGVIYLWHNR